MEGQMRNMQEFEAMIPSLTIGDRILLREKLDDSIENMLVDSHEVSERAEHELMEQRLNDFLAGRIPSKPWPEFREELVRKFNL
jgi:putative addiction module component (TIGR02574 family)